MFQYNDDQIKIVEVGPRDGLQNEKTIVSLDEKFHYIKLLVESGLSVIEATSFVREDKIPQMADAVSLFKKVKTLKDFSLLSFPCLVPNKFGYEKAINCGVKEISLFTATSDAFTKKNINCTVEESFKKIVEVSRQAKKDGVKVRGYISTAFGCPYDGEIGVRKLIEVVNKFQDCGVYEISIGDTIGVATPKQVFHYLEILNKTIDFKMLAMHFHDTKAMALPNILTSLEMGIRIFDSSSGGLGGCPYAKGATGNVATEELLYLVESLGFYTGVDLEKLSQASIYILDKVHKQSTSKLLQNISSRP